MWLFSWFGWSSTKYVSKSLVFRLLYHICLILCPRSHALLFPSRSLLLWNKVLSVTKSNWHTNKPAGSITFQLADLVSKETRQALGSPFSAIQAQPVLWAFNPHKTLLHVPFHCPYTSLSSPQAATEDEVVPTEVENYKIIHVQSTGHIVIELVWNSRVNVFGYKINWADKRQWLKVLCLWVWRCGPNRYISKIYFSLPFSQGVAQRCSG